MKKHLELFETGRPYPRPRINGCGKLISTIHQFSESLGVAIDAKDAYTRSHSVEVAEVSYALAVWLGLGAREAILVHIGGHLHDIGKIGVPACVLNKQGHLTPGEWEVMRRHPQIGEAILMPIHEIVKTGLPKMVLHHHEAFNGKGYPLGLSGYSIPMGARIIAVADSMSAMLGRRSYRPAKTFDEVLEELEKFSGSQFDPRVTAAALRHSSQIKEIFQRLAEEENAVHHNKISLIKRAGMGEC
ncbi:HD-GYP domain-containing protein [Desulfatibacillum aliphaticivorans]|uniref:HD-GYP domain-containing protein n=1 Tax=Desulfatibacillum aliphaticivorans TaxID=218208 RepID=UPI000413AE99|nr:HD-GYP domain-containing protein [Desulfatibacillum aliphaticivorans]